MKRLHARWLVALSWLLSAVIYSVEVNWSRFEITYDQSMLRYIAVVASISLTLITTALALPMPLELIGLGGLVALAAAVSPPGVSHNWHSLQLWWGIAVVTLVTTIWAAAFLRKSSTCRTGSIQRLIALQIFVLLILLSNALAHG